MFERILVPVDGSPSSEKMVDLAVEIAAGSGGEILALSVVDGSIVTMENLASLTADAERLIKDIEEKCMEAGVKVRGIIRTGDPAGEIIGIAGEEKVDTVMMATHAKPLESFVLGSVTEKVLKEITKGILVVTGKFAN